MYRVYVNFVVFICYFICQLLFVYICICRCIKNWHCEAAVLFCNRDFVGWLRLHLKILCYRQNVAMYFVVWFFSTVGHFHCIMSEKLVQDSFIMKLLSLCVYFVSVYIVSFQAYHTHYFTEFTDASQPHRRCWHEYAQPFAILCLLLLLTDWTLQLPIQVQTRGVSWKCQLCYN